jgi:hypothetical protein
MGEVHQWQTIELMQFITPWDRVPSEGINVTKLIQKCHDFYGTSRLVSTFITEAYSTPF